MLFNIDYLNENNNFIITSTNGKNTQLEGNNNSQKVNYSKIYSMKDYKELKTIYGTDNNLTFYIIPWINKKKLIKEGSDKYYIIELCNEKITLNSLFRDEIYAVFRNTSESNHYSGFVYSYKDNLSKELLIASSWEGYISIWDLYEKKLWKLINSKNYYLFHIIPWSNNYAIVADFGRKTIKVIDLINGKIISDIGEGIHKKGIIGVKKYCFEEYGDCLLTAGEDNSINLWCCRF